MAWQASSWDAESWKKESWDWDQSTDKDKDKSPTTSWKDKSPPTSWKVKKEEWSPSSSWKDDSFHPYGSPARKKPSVNSWQEDWGSPTGRKHLQTTPSTSPIDIIKC